MVLLFLFRASGKFVFVSFEDPSITLDARARGRGRSPMCNRTRLACRGAIGRTWQGRGAKTPGQDVTQQAGNGPAVLEGPSGTPLAGCMPHCFRQGGLAKPRPLTCWRREPQRLLKRRCPSPCSPSAKEGLARPAFYWSDRRDAHPPLDGWMGVRDEFRPLPKAPPKLQELLVRTVQCPPDAASWCTALRRLQQVILRHRALLAGSLVRRR